MDKQKDLADLKNRKLGSMCVFVCMYVCVCVRGRLGVECTAL